MPRFKDLTGMTFGKWKVLYRVPNKRSGYTLWRCVCSCGNSLEMDVWAAGLVEGRSTSCGCFRTEQRVKATTTHGHAGKHKRTRTYVSWGNAKQRCYNPNNTEYFRYGGSGVTMCERWHIYENFLEDMGPRPPGTTLDRIDPSGNYEPGNCRWADPIVQSRNTRRCRITHEVAAQMKAVRFETGRSYKSIAEMFGVSTNHARRVITDKVIGLKPR